LLRPQPIV